MVSRRLHFPADFHVSPQNASPAKATSVEPHSVYDAWLASREISGETGASLVPGAPRALNVKNARLAFYVTRVCTFDFVRAQGLYIWNIA